MHGKYCGSRAPERFNAPGKVYLVTRRARSPLPRADVLDGEKIEIVDSWLVPGHDDDEQDDYTLPSLDTLVTARDRAATTARPLSLAYQDDQGDDDVVAVEPAPLILPPDTGQQLAMPQVIEQRATSPRAFSAIRIGRTLLMVVMLYYALSSGVQLAGGSAFPLAPFPWASSSGSATAASFPPLRMDGKVASRVQPMTQMRRLDLYDSRAQFDQWAGSACSAASLAEILTAYGLPHMTIGRMIREMGPDISSQWGLLTYSAFNKVVAKYGLRADVYLENNPLTYKQMLYLTNTLGIPVTVNMRATTGYYRYLSGGHILVMTGGDSKTIRLADSSLYYMKSLPLSVYNQMARSRNVVIVPKDYHYTLPH